jgi:putative ABC transport system permease protein
MGISIDAGRSFSQDYGADSSNYLINWKAAEAMGMTDPVGQSISFWEREGTVVGVMEDFHMNSLYNPIKPVIFRLRPEDAGIVFVRISAGAEKEALAGITTVYEQFNPEFPFEYEFLDEQYEEAYQSEIVIGSLANVFAFVSLLIACLGLFGLASFTAEQRRREIGIRKALGASSVSVVGLLSKEFLILVFAAFLLAAPLAWYAMNNWLSEFEFHTEFGLGLLVVAGASAMTIAWVTVSYQAFRAAAANPVDSLRSD